MIEEENSDYDDESELGDKVPLPAKLVVNRLPTNSNEETKVEMKQNMRRKPSLKQNKDLCYDPDYDMDKDEAIQFQIQESLQDEYSQRKDDEISVGNMSMSTLNNQEIKDYLSVLKARNQSSQLVSAENSSRKN